MSIAVEPETDAALRAVEERVLWLATAIVDHANRVRPNPDGLKVGGHQASSASMVTIMTSLWLEQLGAEDRVSVKPHASPVLHALEYLLGELDAGLPDHAAGVRRPAELPEPAQGPGAGRLLHRLGRHRRDRTDLGRAGPPVRRRALRRRRHRPAVVAGRRRRARRGRGLGGRARPDGGRARRGRLGRRPQPAVAGPGRPDHGRGPAAGHVRRGRLAGAHGQVRPAAGGAVRPARRRGAAGPDRRDVQPRVPAAAAPRPGRAARRAARRRPRRRRHRRADRRTSRTTGSPRRSATSAGTTSARCGRRTRPSTTPGRR